LGGRDRGGWTQRDRMGGRGDGKICTLKIDTLHTPTNTHTHNHARTHTHTGTVTGADTHTHTHTPRRQTLFLSD
jgi:hypothetical protein